MILDNWLEQLRKAKTEEAVVGFAQAHFERITATGKMPEVLVGQALSDGEDLRRMAASLTRAQVHASDSPAETDVVQQILILFSLATDRLNQLEGHGLARRAPNRQVPMR